MVERLGAGFCSRDEDREILPRLRLTDEFGEAFRAQARFQIVVIATLRRNEAIRSLIGRGFGLGRCHQTTHFARTVRYFACGLKCQTRDLSGSNRAGELAQGFADKRVQSGFFAKLRARAGYRFAGSDLRIAELYESRDGVRLD